MTNVFCKSVHSVVGGGALGFPVYHRDRTGRLLHSLLTKKKAKLLKFLAGCV